MNNSCMILSHQLKRHTYSFLFHLLFQSTIRHFPVLTSFMSPIRFLSLSTSVLIYTLQVMAYLGAKIPSIGVVSASPSSLLFFWLDEKILSSLLVCLFFNSPTFLQSSNLYFSFLYFFKSLIHNTSGKFVPMPSCHIAMNHYSRVGWTRRSEYLNFGGDEC